MTSELSTYDEVSKQLLENQTFLYTENQKLQNDVKDLSSQLENLKKSSVKPEIFEALKKEKNNLLQLNETLKKKIHAFRTPPNHLTHHDIAKEKKQKQDLLSTVLELEDLMKKVKCYDRLDIKPPKQDLTLVVESLTKKLEDEQRKREEAYETIRKLREDDEKYVLRERITDLKQLITDLEIENSKLKFEIEQINDDMETYKKQLNDATEEAKLSAQRCCELEEERYKLKDVLSNLENEKIELKKEMIQEMTEANRAKRVSMDTEIALQHIAEAYETKRKEVARLTGQLEDAEKVMKQIKRQFAPPEQTA